MFYRKIKILFICFLPLIFEACDVPIDWQLQNADTSYLIVESIITNEYKNQEVKLSRSVMNLNAKSQPVSFANITISDDENIYTFVEDSCKLGTYYSQQKFIATVDRIYTLKITAENQAYAAQAYCLPVNDFEPVGYMLDTAKNLYRLINIPNQFSGNEDAMYQIIIDMSMLPEYADSSYEQSHILLFYYTLRSIDVPEIYSPEYEKIFFPKGSIITEKKFSLTPEHAAFVRSLLLETTWHGGAFDVDQGNVVTNLSNGALGFFAACSVIEKQIIVE